MIHISQGFFSDYINSLLTFFMLAWQVGVDSVTLCLASRTHLDHRKQSRDFFQERRQSKGYPEFLNSFSYALISTVCIKMRQVTSIRAQFVVYFSPCAFTKFLCEPDSKGERRYHLIPSLWKLYEHMRMSR